MITGRNLGGSCSYGDSNNKQCIDQNASCQGSSYICSCDDGYHQDGSICKPSKSLNLQIKETIDI
jgi:hypothetical protein